jgi:hypothetical protein
MIFLSVLIFLLINSSAVSAREYFFELNLESDYVTPFGLSKFPAYKQYNFKSDYAWGNRKSFNASFAYEIANGFYINPSLFFGQNEGYFKGHASSSELYGVGSEPVLGKVEYVFSYKSSDYGFGLNGGIFIIENMWLSAGFDYRIPLNLKNWQYERIVSPSDVYFLDEESGEKSRTRNQLATSEDKNMKSVPGFNLGAGYQMPLGSDQNYNITIGTNLRFGLGEVSIGSGWKDWQVGLSIGIRYYEEKYIYPKEEKELPSLDEEIFFASVFTKNGNSKNQRILNLEITDYVEKRFVWKFGKFKNIDNKTEQILQYNADRIKFYYETDEDADSLICKISNGKSFIFPVNLTSLEFEIDDIFFSEDKKIEARLFVYNDEQMTFSQAIVLEKKTKHLGKISGVVIEFEGNLKSLNFSNIPNFGVMNNLEIFSDKAFIAGRCSEYFDEYNPRVSVDGEFIKKYRIKHKSDKNSNKPILFLRFR